MIWTYTSLLLLLLLVVVVVVVVVENVVSFEMRTKWKMITKITQFMSRMNTNGTERALTYKDQQDDELHQSDLSEHDR